MSSCSVENQNPNSSSPLNWSNLWLKNKKALDHVVATTIRRRSFYRKPPPTPPPPSSPPSPPPEPDNVAVVSNSPLPQQPNNETLVSDSPQIDLSENFTSLLSDETLQQILSKLPDKSHRNSTSLVSKSWLNLQGRLVRTIRVLDWGFLTSSRMFSRFPNLIDIDLLHGSVVSSSTKSCGLTIGREFGYFHIDSDESVLNNHVLLPVHEIDFSLKTLAKVYPNLQRLVVVNCSEMGLLSVAEGCPTLQELVLHKCHDQILCGIAAFKNLQILKLIGTIDGFYGSLVSDIGLTILAQGCKRLVKLELRGCEGSYDGIRAIGQCCQMLEELTFWDHRMDGGWLSALSCCENLKTLRLVSCKSVDRSPGLDEHLGFCRMLERLHLERCQLRDKQSLRALFLVCRNVRDMVLKNCWGLKDGLFLNANLCRRLKFLSLEGCSRLTTEGLESVVLSLKELKTLKVISCKNIKDGEVSPALSMLFSTLKNLKWTPDNMSLLSTSLLGSGMGKRGAKFFKKLQI